MFPNISAVSGLDSAPPLRRRPCWKFPPSTPCAPFQRVRQRAPAWIGGLAGRTLLAHPQQTSAAPPPGLPCFPADEDEEEGERSEAPDLTSESEDEDMPGLLFSGGRCRLPVLRWVHSLLAAVGRQRQPLAARWGSSQPCGAAAVTCRRLCAVSHCLCLHRNALLAATPCRRR